MRHWNNTGKRGLALFLALLMCVNLLSLTAFAAEESAENGGWYQDAQTVKDGSSDAVCDASNGSLHLKAQTGSGNGRGDESNKSGWPTVFVNEAVNEALYGTGVDVNATKFVELTFTPVYDQSKPFGVFLNYSEPGNGFLVGYDWNDGWCWQPCDSNTYPNEPWYTGTRVSGPNAGAATTLRVEWQGTTLTKATVDGNDLFGGTEVDFSVNTGKGFGIKCAGDTEVTISHFDCGVVAEEPPAQTTISGTVTDGSNPVEGAVVTLENASYMPVAGVETVTTGADGAFTFEGVTATDCKVKVQADGYQVTTVDASTSAAVSVALEAETTGTKVYTNNNGDLTQMGGFTEANAPTFGTVDGAVKVTFNGNRDENNAVVKEFDFVNGEISFDITPTGNTSRFGITLRGTAGDNRIFVGQNYTTSTWFWNTWTTGADPVERYNTSQDKNDVPLSVQSGVTRNVRVKIEGSTVSAYLDGIEAYTITLPDGIPTGAGFAGIVANSADPVELDNIRVVSFDSDEPTPPATYTLSGKVMGEDGAAVNGATVTVGDKTATTDASGAYSIAGLESGTYDVSVSAEGYTAQSAQVAVSGNTTKNWTLAQPDPTATYTVKGSVYTMPGNWALWYWTMEVKQGGEVLQTIESSKKNAAFTITGLAAGTYTLEVSSKGYQTAQKEITVTDQDLDKVFIQLYKPEKLECGVEPNTVFYELNGTELRIYGEGAMTDWAKVSSSYSGDDPSTVVPWGTVKLTKVTIENGVTNVGNKAFSGQTALKEVTLPDSVTKIGGEAFKGCYWLENVAIPAGVTEIGNSAFEGCTRLNNVTLSAGLTEIANDVFNGCRAFTEITIPDGVTKIGEAAFAGCDSLAAVNWGKVKVIGERAFSGCALTGVVLPETVTILYDGAFGNCHSLTSIVIPDDVALRNKVFQYCRALENVVLLGEPHLTFTDKVGYGESSNDVFREVYNTNPLFIYASGDAWMAKLARMSETGVNTYYIANLDGGVLDGTFETGKLATPTKEGCTFQGWKDAEGNDLAADTAKGTVFTAQWTEKTVSIQVSATASGEKTDAVIENGMVTIPGGYTLWVDGAQIATIPKGVTSVKVPVDAVSSLLVTPNDRGSTSLTLPEGSSALLPDGSTVTDLKLHFFTSNSTYEVFVPSSGLLLVSGTGNMKDYGKSNQGAPWVYWGDYREHITEVKIMDGVTGIGKYAFSKCTMIKVTIPETVTTIGQYAFFECAKLTDISLPSNLTKIDNYTFSGCTSLAQITFPESVTTIGDYAFENSGLTSVTVPTAGTTIKAGAFDRCTSLETVILPDGVKLSGVNIFRDMSNHYPNSSLKTIVFQGTPAEIYETSYSGIFGTWGTFKGLMIYVSSSDVDTTKLVNALNWTKNSTYNFAVLNGGTIAELNNTGFATLESRESENLTFLGWFDEGGNEVETPAYDKKTYTAMWEEPKTVIEISATANGERTEVEADENGMVTIPGGYTLWVDGAKIATVPKGVTSVAVPEDAVTKLQVKSTTTTDTMTLPAGSETIFPDGSKGNDTKVYCCKSGSTYVTIGEQSGLLFVSGEGPMADYKSSVDQNKPWLNRSVNYIGSVTEIRVLDGVTHVGNYAFKNLDKKLKTVIISDTVETIGEGAFRDCLGLSHVELPNGLKVIEENVFYYCPALTEIEIPESVTEIKRSAFHETGLVSITIPGKGAVIDMYAFEYSPYLETIIFPDGVTLNSAPYFMKHSKGVNLKNIVFLGTPAQIGVNLFGSNKPYLEDLTIYVSSSDADVTNFMDSIFWSSTCRIANLNGYTVSEYLEGALAEPVKDGEVGVWYDEAGNALVKGENGYALPEDEEFGAVYTVGAPKAVYTVTVDGKAHSVTQGDTLAGILPENPTKEYFDFIGWFNGADEVTADTVVAGNMTITAKWIAAKPVFNDHAYVWVYVYYTDKVYVCGTTIEDSSSPYITLSDVVANDGSNSLAPASTYPWQCTLTLHVNGLLKSFGYKMNGYVWNGEDDMSVTLYSTKYGGWGTWVDKVGGMNTKANFYLYVDKVERTGDVEVSVEPVGTLTAGENATFQVTVTNNTNVDVEFVSAPVYLFDNDSETASYFDKAYDSNGNEVPLVDEWYIDIGNLTAGDSVKFTLEKVIPESMAWHKADFIGYAWDYYWSDWLIGPQTNVALNVQCGHEWSYVDNGDGTHNHICATCNHIVEADLAHEFEDGKCVCGALQIYTVTVDGTEHTVNHGDTLAGILPENPTREGYTFQGWFNGETEVTAETVVNGEMTITARWTAIPTSVTRYTLTINYVDESGSTVAPSHTQRLTSGSNYNVASPAVEGMDPDQAVVSGRLTRNTTVTVTYTANTSIEEPDVPLAELPLPFEDVKDSDWYREAVAYVWSNSLMLGTSDKLFGVETNTTRGMMSTMLYRLEKEPSVAFEKVFDDVDDGKWFSAAITWANAYGVVKGYDNGCFGPDDNVTREQLVTMLYRYATKKGFDVSKKADLSKFVDADKVSGYAKEAMSWAVSEGIIKGCGANDLAPTSQALRVEVATIFQRFAARYMTVETTA